MKKYLSIISLLVFAVTLSAQDAKVPQAVQNAFSKLYPNVTAVKWDKEGADQFEAGFTIDGTQTSVIINSEGEVEETETAIRVNELPAAVAPYVNQNYPEFEISEAAKIVNDDGVVTYEAEISKGNTKKDLLFDKDGNHLERKSKIEKAEDAEDED